MKQSCRVLIIGGRRKLLAKASGLGLHVIAVQQPGQVDQAQLTSADELHAFDYSDIDRLVALARALSPLDYVLSPTEHGLMPAAHVNDALALPGNSLRTVALLRDKWAMRQHLNGAGVSPVGARTGSTCHDLHAFAADYGTPFIVKPVDGVGSFGVSLVRTPLDLDSTWLRLQQLNLERFLMEEYLDGPEISVESLSHLGQHVVIAMTDKWKLDNFVEVGHTVPAVIRDPELRRAVESAVLAFLTCVDFREGPAHTELKLTRSGPRIVESHNRIGGDQINDLVHTAYGVDMSLLSLACPLDLAPLPPANMTPTAAAAIRFFTPPPGIIERITGFDEVRQQPDVVAAELSVQVGAEMPEIRDSHDRAGYVLVRGADPESASRRCDALAAAVHIQTQAPAGRAMQAAE